MFYFEYVCVWMCDLYSNGYAVSIGVNYFLCFLFFTEALSLTKFVHDCPADDTCICGVYE